MGRSARPHIILGVNLEEEFLGTIGQYRGQVLRLEAYAGKPGERPCLFPFPDRMAAQLGRSRLRAFGDPLRPPGNWMFAQVPCLTNFHELPWKSTGDVPWHAVPG